MIKNVSGAPAITVVWHASIERSFSAARASLGYGTGTVHLHISDLGWWEDEVYNLEVAAPQPEVITFPNLILGKKRSYISNIVYVFVIHIRSFLSLRVVNFLCHVIGNQHFNSAKPH